MESDPTQSGPTLCHEYRPDNGCCNTLNPLLRAAPPHARGGEGARLVSRPCFGCRLHLIEPMQQRRSLILPLRRREVGSLRGEAGEGNRRLDGMLDGGWSAVGGRW